MRRTFESQLPTISRRDLLKISCHGPCSPYIKDRHGGFFLVFSFLFSSASISGSKDSFFYSQFRHKKANILLEPCASRFGRKWMNHQALHKALQMTAMIVALKDPESEKQSSSLIPYYHMRRRQTPAFTLSVKNPPSSAINASHWRKRKIYWKSEFGSLRAFQMLVRGISAWAAPRSLWRVEPNCCPIGLISGSRVGTLSSCWHPKIAPSTKP